MGTFQIIVIMRSVQICGHTADKVVTILPLIIFTHFKPRDFRDGIRLVRLLQRTRQQRVLRDWLGRHSRINTGAPQKQQFFDVILMTTLDDITLYLHVLIGKLRGRGIVRIDAAHLCRRQNYRIRALFFKKLPHRLLTGQVKFPVRPANDIFITLCLQGPHNRAAHQPSVSCHVDFVRPIHNNIRLHFSHHTISRQRLLPLYL